MTRYASWTLNAALFVACCYAAADIANNVFGEMLLSAPAQAAPLPSQLDSAEGPGTPRRVILERNLFNVSTLAPQPAPVTEDLEATKLPLRLLGTAAADDPALSRAAVEDLETRQHLVVRIDDRLRNQVRVTRIERRRIVLQNGERFEELALGEGDEAGPQTKQAARRRDARKRRPAPSTAKLSERIRRLGRDRFSVDRKDVAAVARNPATLFSQARILPKYEDGEMLGFQLSYINSGSLYEEVGIQNGEVITELNGIRIDSQEQMAKIIREFAAATEFEVEVMDADGNSRSLSFSVPADE